MRYFLRVEADEEVGTLLEGGRETDSDLVKDACDDVAVVRDVEALFSTVVGHVVVIRGDLTRSSLMLCRLKVVWYNIEVVKTDGSPASSGLAYLNKERLIGKEMQLLTVIFKMY